MKRVLKGAVLFSLVGVFGVAVSGAINKAESASTDKPVMLAAAATTKAAPAPKIDPNDPKSIIYLDTAGKPAGIGDPNKPASAAYQAGSGWHPQALSAAGLPKDRYGLVDWAKLVRANIINPKHSLDPAAEEMPPLPMDVLIEAKGDFVNDVIYPHEMHTYWLSCEVCHPAIFVPAKGTNNMTMVGIVQGQWCGRCHGKVAFPLTDCNRCHTSPKKSAKK
jgi:c(7)-type cytochrome triheme protein